jgi:hypothetical protein
MEFIEKLDNPVPMENYDGDTYYIYPVYVEATPQEKNNLLEFLKLVSKKDWQALAVMMISQISCSS